MQARTEATVYYRVNDNVEIKRHWSHATPFEVPESTLILGGRVVISEIAVATILIALFSEELQTLFPGLEINKDCFDWDINAVWPMKEGEI